MATQGKGLKAELKRKAPAPEVIAKGAAALAEWRKAKAAAKKKGGAALAKWEAAEKLKREQKRVSPMQAIRNFCLTCVGDIRADVTNCSATKCPLYIYRPYQDGQE